MAANARGRGVIAIGPRVNGIFRKELYTQIVIQATAEAVWRVLTDFERYPEWNPYISSIEGKFTAGERLEVKFIRGQTKSMTFRPTVQYSEAFREVRWMGHLILPLVLDGEHSFVITPIEGGSIRFVQKEIFTGLLVPLLWRDLDTHTREGFRRMNRALKERVERTEG